MATAAVIMLSLASLAFFVMAYRFDYKNNQLRRKLDRLDGKTRRGPRKHRRLLRQAYLA